MLAVLQVVFRKHGIAGGGRIAGELLILLVDVLRMTTDLDVVRPVRVEGAVGVLAWLDVCGWSAAAGAVAPALTFHALEISHVRRL